MNRDYLRVGNYDKENKDIVMTEFKKKVVKETNKKSYTLFSILSLNKNKNIVTDQSLAVELPKPTLVFTLFLLLCSLNFILYFVALVTAQIPVLILMVLVSSLIIPLFAVIFFYEMNTNYNISISQIVLCIIVGAGINIASFIISDIVEQGILATNTIYTFAWTVINNVMLFFASVILAKLLKKTNFFAIILIAVSVYSGYILVDSIMKLTTALMVTVNITYDNSLYYTSGAIINESLFFKSSIEKFISSLAYQAFFVPAVVLLIGVINGGVIAMTGLINKTEKFPINSMYILLILTALLHAFLRYPTTITYVNIVLRIVSFTVSLGVAIKIVNYSLSKGNYIIK